MAWNATLNAPLEHTNPPSPTVTETAMIVLKDALTVRLQAIARCVRLLPITITSSIPLTPPASWMSAQMASLSTLATASTTTVSTVHHALRIDTVKSASLAPT